MGDKSIKELTADNVLMSAYLLLQEIQEIRARLALELQAARDDRRAQYKEVQELMAEVRDTLINIQARFMVDAHLLNLIRPDKTGETVCQRSEGESSSSPSRMLTEFAKSTH